MSGISAESWDRASGWTVKGAVECDSQKVHGGLETEETLKTI